MSIFNRNVKRERPLPNVINRKPQDSTSVPLVVGLYTPTIITENYDYVQLYYHGGGVYTAVTFVLDYKNGLRITHGRVLEDLLEHHPYTNSKKELEVLTNPFDGSNVCTNLRIKTIGTFVTNDDSAIKQFLVENGKTSITINKKPIQLIDARHSTNEHECGTWYSPTNTFVEYRNEPNGDFVETIINTWHQESDGNVVFPKERLVEKLINVHLPNLQKQLFIEVLEQCME